jgi:hypothetical protein
MTDAITAIRAAIDAEYARSPAPPSTDDFAAAVLRAVADQVVPPCSTRSDRGTQRMMIRHELLAIAAELEGSG